MTAASLASPHKRELLALLEEKARRRKVGAARESLRAYCGMIEIPGAPIGDEPDDGTDWRYAPVETPLAAHHELLISKLQDVADGKIRRVMIFMPPGSAKSTYASVVFPSWIMGRRQRLNVGVATYATDLARKVGRRVRSIVRQPIYREVFGTSIAADQAAANEWALENGNEFMGAGILAGWTGNRLDGLIVDDPVKNREEAGSEVIQQKVRSEFDDSLKSRLKPGGWIVVIMTRWDEADLAGGLLPETWDGESGPIMCRDGLVWEIICIPAEAEDNDILGRKPGEMLWTEWFGQDPDFWTSARRNHRTWSALYQQRPSPPSGSFFQREWFRRFRPGEEPKHLRKYLTSDHAPTDSDTSDPSGCRVFGVAENNDLYILDGFLHRATMDVTADRIVGNLKTGPSRDPAPVPMTGLIRKHEPFAWFPEDDNNWKTASPFILRQMKAEGVRTRIEPISPHGSDKAMKAQSFQGMAAMGQVFIPEGPEGDAIIEQFVKFPAGKHDEEVDMAGIMGRAIAMAHPAIVPPEAKDPGPLKGIREMTFNELLASQTPTERKV